MVQPSLGPNRNLSPTYPFQFGTDLAAYTPDYQSREGHLPHFADGKTEVQGGEGHFSKVFFG